MSKVNSGPSIYIPTDKNIFDALQHKKITQAELVLFLRKRGILISSNTSKQELIEKICSMTLSYTDFNWIAKLLENPNKKDKTTHTKLNGVIDLEQVRTACSIIKANLTSQSDDSVKVTKSGDKTIFKVTYVDHDFTKTELRQRTIKTCEIEIEQGSDGVVMKLPSTKKAKEVTEQLKVALKAQVVEKGQQLEEHMISLSGISDPILRSQFFDYLIRNVDGLEFDNVSSVDVYHFEHEQRDEFEDDEAADSRLASYINKAALAGEGVLESTEFKQLHKQGFYIYKIIWTSVEKSYGGAKVEFEAQFGEPLLCSDFMYSVRGIYPFNIRTTEHNVTRNSATAHENDKYNIKLRDASEKALQKVINEYGAE